MASVPSRATAIAEGERIHKTERMGSKKADIEQPIADFNITRFMPCRQR
jgi:hypothetical protein